MMLRRRGDYCYRSCDEWSHKADKEMEVLLMNERDKQQDIQQKYSGCQSVFDFSLSSFTGRRNFKWNKPSHEHKSI